MNSIEDLFAMIFIIGSGVLVIFIIARYYYLLRKALADRGVMPGKFNMSYSEIACIVIGIGVGLAVSSIFTMMQLSEDTMDLLIWATILIGAGLGLFAAHFIRQKLGKGQ